MGSAEHLVSGDFDGDGFDDLAYIFELNGAVNVDVHRNTEQSTQPIDGRKGPDSLMALVRDVLCQDPLSGHLFIFFSKRCDRVRIVYWDRNGYAMWTKRLEKGRFRPTTFWKDGRLSSVSIEACGGEKLGERGQAALAYR